MRVTARVDYAVRAARELLELVTVADLAEG